MDFIYKQREIEQGQRNKLMAEETPHSFGESGGAIQFTPGQDLAHRSQRMAGEVGARTLQLLNDPVEKKRTDNWMAAFGMSNQGMEFNQAQAMQMAPPPEEASTGEPKPEQEPDPNKDEDPRP